MCLGIASAIIMYVLGWLMLVLCVFGDDFASILCVWRWLMYFVWRWQMPVFCVFGIANASILRVWLMLVFCVFEDVANASILCV